jgi:hypothetical protein
MTLKIVYGQKPFVPDTLEGYIGNEHIIEKVKIFIANGDVPTFYSMVQLALAKQR